MYGFAGRGGRLVRTGDGAEMRTHRTCSSLAAWSASLSASGMRSGPCDVRTYVPSRTQVLLHASIIAVAGMRRTWNREMRSVIRLGQPCTSWISTTCAHPSQQWNTCTPLRTCGSVSTEGTAHARVSLVSMVNLRVSLFAVYLQSPPASNKPTTCATACDGIDSASLP
jgi:hypothetical protein